MCLPSLQCDYFQLTSTEGRGNGETFARFPVAKGDCLMGDRGYPTAPGIAHVVAAGGHVLVRVNTGSLSLVGADGERFDWLQATGSLGAGSVGAWPVTTAPRSEVRNVAGRVCAIRQSATAIEIAQKKLRETAISQGKALKPPTLELAKYIIVFTT